MASRSAKKARIAQAQALNPRAPLTKQETKKTLTIMDMQEAYTKGYEDGFEQGRELGFKQASTHTTRCLFGAVIIAAHSLFGFGQERCIRLLNGVYKTTLETLTEREMAERAFDEVGVEIDWTEPVEVAQPKTPARKRKDHA